MAKKVPVSRNCPDCGVRPGEIHKGNCDVERCSSCGGQFIGCGCEDHDRFFARWTGFWPGSLEADALGVDLNEFIRRGYGTLFFVKPKGAKHGK
jgi:hypothetical protein